MPSSVKKSKSTNPEIMLSTPEPKHRLSSNSKNGMRPAAKAKGGKKLILNEDVEEESNGNKSKKSSNNKS